MPLVIEQGIAFPEVRSSRVYTSHGPCDFCGNPKHYAKGLCRKCWNRNQSHGSPEYLLRPGETLEEKFTRSYRIDEGTGCWIWTRPACNDRPLIGGESARKFAFDQVQGVQPARTKYEVTCGNKLCVNPDHIKAQLRVTEKEKVALIRSVSGESKKVAAKRLRQEGMTLQEIGQALGFTRERARQLIHDMDVPRTFKRLEMEERAARIASLLAEGHTRTEIAARLGINPHNVWTTIKRHVKKSIEGENSMDYIVSLKKRRQDLQAKVDEFKPVLDELRRVKAALSALQGSRKHSA